MKDIEIDVLQELLSQTQGTLSRLNLQDKKVTLHDLGRYCQYLKERHYDCEEDVMKAEHFAIILDKLLTGIENCED